MAMNLRNTILTIATLAALASPALATEAWEHEENASNHGYETAALEVICGGMLTAANAKLRAKLDKMYRETPRWREHFLRGYEAVAGRAEVIATKGDHSLLWMTCTNAGRAKWLKLDPAARDLLEINMKKHEAERKAGK
jgi:hypothetical protein